MNLENPAFIDPSLDGRAVTFENPTGARGAGGSAHGGRKGAPNMRIARASPSCSRTSTAPARSATSG